MWKKITVIVLTIVLLLSAVFGILFSFKNETQDIEMQEEVNEQVADEYLIAMSQQENANLPNNNEPEESLPSDFDYEDNHIFADIPESQAQGDIDFIIEIPALDLRQSVYKGTTNEILHDLSIWMAVAARPHYELGKTQYCIYTHNPRNKSIRFSWAQELLHKDDYMIVTQGQKVFFYRVDDVFPEWRDKCVEKYVDATNVPSDKLYIFTCGRDAWGGRNVVVEGTLKNIYQLSEWNKNKDKYIEEYKKEVGLIREDPLAKENLVLDIKNNQNNLIINLTGPDGVELSNCKIAIFGEDGFLKQNIVENNPMAVIPNMQINNLPDGTYYIGVYENDTPCGDPIPFKITINTKDNASNKIVNVVDDANHETRNTKIMKYVAIGMLCLAILMAVACLIKVIKDEKASRICDEEMEQKRKNKIEENIIPDYEPNRDFDFDDIDDDYEDIDEDDIFE